jgi:cytochrome c-type biogenesis protein
MDFGVGTYVLGYAAGVLSTLSPCVLPLLPILIASAVVSHRWGVYALAMGLIISFAAVGTLVASIGASLGVEPTMFRNIGAVILIAFGVVLLSVSLQQKFASATSSLSGLGDSLLAKLNVDGVKGQFLIGLALGVIWSPCVGPTLGAATTLAAQGSSLPQVALLMAIFGLGAGSPLVLLGSLSRSTVMRMRGKMLSAGAAGKYVLGSVFVLIGLAIISGLDKAFETWILALSPDWLTQLTTRY